MTFGTEDWDAGEVIRQAGRVGEKPSVMMVPCDGDSATGAACEDSMEGVSEESHGDSVVVEPDRSVSGDCAGFSRVGGESEMLRSGALSGSLASIMETTIFSKSSEVMCRSRPRLRLLAHESCRRIRGRMMSTGADSAVKSTASSSGTESTLPDSWGRSSADESRFCWISCG